MPSTSHLAELEIESADVVAAWNALEPVIARCAESLGRPVRKSDYHLDHPDERGTVAGAELGDCLDRVASPASISAAYLVGSDSGAEPHIVELRISRYRRFKELNVKLRVDGPADVHTLGFFERTQQALAQTIDRVSGS